MANIYQIGAGLIGRAMALDLAKKTDYDGLEILEIAMLALTDVNYHPEAKAIRDMILKIENDPMGK